MKNIVKGVFSILLAVSFLAAIFFVGISKIPPNPSTYTRVVILAGQSNMVGGARIDLLTKEKVGEERYERISQPFENVKFVVEQGFPDTAVSDFRSVELGVGGYVENAFGPEIGFAEEISKCEGTTYIIKCAFSGTTLCEHWKSPSMSEDGQGSERYQIFTNFIDKNLKKLEDAGLKPKIVAMCWMQGESDAASYEASVQYRSNLEKFVGDLRARYNKKSINNTLHFIDATIDGQWPCAAIVNAHKYEFADSFAANHIIDTLKKGLVDPNRNGLVTDTEPTVGMTEVDPLHYDTTSVLKLGNMFAEVCRQIARI